MGEKGWENYPTLDGNITPSAQWDYASTSSRTLGEFVKKLRLAGVFSRLMYVTYAAGGIFPGKDDPVLCMYAARFKNDGKSLATQIENTLASNCVKIYTLVPTCSITVSDIIFDFGKIQKGQTAGARKTESLIVNCTRATNLEIKVGAGGVALNDSAMSKVNFSFDNGPFDNVWSGSVNGQRSIALTAELPDLEVGSWSGSAVLVVSPN